MVAELTQQLAELDSVAFKDSLIGGLRERSVYGHKLWATIVYSGTIQANQPQIDSSGWVSRSNAQHGYIHLGTQSLPSRYRSQLIFDDQNINYEQEITLRLLHEASHLFEAYRISSESESIQDLLRTAQTVRSINRNLGLTAVGSLTFYDDSMRFREDTAELISMYTFDPEYLKSYLSYLNKPVNTSTLNQVGVTVVPGFKNDLFTLVEDTVQEGLEN